MLLNRFHGFINAIYILDHSSQLFKVVPIIQTIFYLLHECCQIRCEFIVTINCRHLIFCVIYVKFNIGYMTLFLKNHLSLTSKTT